MVVMDSTFKTVKYDIPLYFICVLSNMTYNVVASFLIGNDNNQEICKALEVLKCWNPSWKPESFMCDLDQREINACEKVFEGTCINILPNLFGRRKCLNTFFTHASCS